MSKEQDPNFLIRFLILIVPEKLNLPSQAQVSILSMTATLFGVLSLSHTSKITTEQYFEISHDGGNGAGWPVGWGSARNSGCYEWAARFDSIKNNKQKDKWSKWRFLFDFCSRSFLLIFIFFIILKMTRGFTKGASRITRKRVACFVNALSFKFLLKCTTESTTVMGFIVNFLYNYYHSSNMINPNRTGSLILIRFTSDIHLMSFLKLLVSVTCFY